MSRNKFAGGCLWVKKKTAEVSSDGTSVTSAVCLKPETLPSPDVLAKFKTLLPVIRIETIQREIDFMDTVNKTSNGFFSSFLRQYQLIIFFVLTLALSTGLAMVAIIIGDKNITILSVFTPSLTAIALTALVSGKAGLRELLVKQTKQRVKFRWIVISLITFPLIAAIAIGFHSLFGGPALTLRTTELLPQVIIILLIALGEEYGWRGYALPRLQQRYKALVASLILGLGWGFWHFPGYLIGVGVPLEIPFYVFMLWVFAATILITWVYNNTRSVMMPILMHVAANATFNYLYLLPEFTGQITTFWLFLGLLWLVTVIVIIVFGPTYLSGVTSTLKMTLPARKKA